MTPEQYISQTLAQIGSKYDFLGVKKLIREAISSEEVIMPSEVISKILDNDRCHFVNTYQAQDFTKYFTDLWNQIAEEVRPTK